MLETIEVSRVKRFAANTAGRDFAVGDIHGHFTRLQAALDAVGFDPAADRLFSVGDLVDRGPECEDVIKWLNKPWFHPVRGNHDDYVCRFDTCDIGNWMYNGGVWFVGLPLTEQQNYQVIFQELPIAIEVETAQGLIGIVHADCPFHPGGSFAMNWNRPKATSGSSRCRTAACGRADGSSIRKHRASKASAPWSSDTPLSDLPPRSATSSTSTLPDGCLIAAISRCST